MHSPPTYQETTSAQAALQPSHELVIAIDFGTTFTGVAYAWCVPGQTRIDTLVENITVVKHWPFSSFAGSNEKIPTVLSFSKSPPLWGGYVQKYHTEKARNFKLGLQKNLESHYHSDSPLFELSKLGLFNESPSQEECSAPSGKSPVDLSAEFLKRVLEYVQEIYIPKELSATFFSKFGPKVSYILTVPAIWNDDAKDLTRQAASRAGIPDDKLELITEPEAAALFCATKNPQLNLNPGDCFMVCDAGGGTVVCISLLCV